MSSDKSGLELNEMLFFTAIVVLLIGMYMYSSHFYIFADIWRHVRIAELHLFQWMPTWLQDLTGLEVDKSLHFLQTRNGHEIAPETVKRFDTHWARRLSWIPGIFFIWCGIRFIKKGDQATRIYTNETLLQRQSQFYDHVKPFVDIHPEQMELRFRREDTANHAYCMSVSPHEFATMNPPLGLEQEATKKQLFARPIYIETAEDFDDDLAERAFIKQLGRPYLGLHGMSELERRLYDEIVRDFPWSRDYMVSLVSRMLSAIAKKEKHFDTRIEAEKQFFRVVMEWVTAETTLPNKTNKNVWWTKIKSSLLKFLPKSNGSKEEGKKAKADGLWAQIVANARKLFPQKALKTMAQLSSEPSMLAFVDRPENVKAFRAIEAERIMSRHAYVRTGLMSVLLRLRDAGTFPPSKYKQMLKGADRTLWYCITSLGKNVSFPESAGPFCHWRVECVVGRPLPKPEVTAAVENLRVALKLPPR